MTDKTIVRRFTDTKVIVRQSDTPAKVIIRNLGPKGDDGASAYAVAVANGFVGSEAAWLDSLVGADGSGSTGSGLLHGDGVPSVWEGIRGNYYLDRSTGDLYRREWVKPAAWAWAVADVLPAFQGVAAKLLFAAPLLEGSGAPYDLVSGVQAVPRAGPTPTWVTKDGIACMDGATGGQWEWTAPPLPAMNQPFSVLQIIQEAGFISLPNVNVENFAGSKIGGLDPYYGTALDDWQPANAYAGLYYDNEPSRGPVWHATVITLVSRGVAGAAAIDGMPPSTPVVNSDDGTLLGEVNLAPTTWPLHLGFTDDPNVTDPQWGQGGAGVFSQLTQEEAELVSGDPFGVVWPAADTSQRTAWVRILEGATQAELDAVESALDGRATALEATAPTANQKAALVGTGTPSGSDKYVSNSDGRMSDARTPTAHSHPESEVTNLVTDLAGKIPATEKGAASGVATLDGGGKVPSAQLPAVALVKPTVVADLTARLALTAQAGDVAVQTDTTKTYMLKEAGDPTVDADWIELKAPSGAAPAAAPFVTFATDPTLSAERVVTDTPTVAWDLATAGQAKASVPDDAVTNAKAANMATATMKGRKTAGTGDPEDLSAADSRTNMGLGSLATVTPSGTPDGTKFLRDDNSWQAASGGASAATASVLGTVKIAGTPTDAANPTVLVQEQIPATARLKIGATPHLYVPGAVMNATTTLGLAANVVYYSPLIVYGRVAVTLDSLVCEITTAASAGKKCQMGLYVADTDWQPVARVVAPAEFAADALGVVTKGSLATSLPPGRYLTAITMDGNTSFRAVTGGLIGGPILATLTGSPVIYKWTKNRTYAALPDPGVVADVVANGGTGGFFTVFLGLTP